MGILFMSTSCDSNLLSGTLSHVAHVAKSKTGKKPSPATVWRWCKKGMRGGKIKLKAIYHSGYWQTTPEAFDEFLQRQTDYALAKPKDDATDAELEAVGLL